ncbi:MAG: PCP reductase family protein [Candidatus Methylomirabilia bacterium]
MKFLCVECDEPMRLQRSEGPDEGSLTATFGCPRCSRRIAMLTNPFETQLVRSLGVKVGGRDKPIVPFEHLRASMAHQREQAFQAGDAATPQGAGADVGVASGENSTPGCPFAAMVAGQEEGSSGSIAWSPEAEARIERIPSFIRPMAKKAIERYAEGKRYRLITEAIMDEARSALGM